MDYFWKLSNQTCSIWEKLREGFERLQQGVAIRYPFVTGRLRISSLLLLRLHEGAPRQHETTSIQQEAFKRLESNMMTESAGCLLQTVALFALHRSYYEVLSCCMTEFVLGKRILDWSRLYKSIRTSKATDSSMLWLCKVDMYGLQPRLNADYTAAHFLVHLMQCIASPGSRRREPLPGSRMPRRPDQADQALKLMRDHAAG